MTFNRLVLVCFGAIALTWIGLYLVDLRERANDRALYEHKSGPTIKSADGFDQAALDEWRERGRRHLNNEMARLCLFGGGMGLFMVWIATVMVRGELFWKRRNAADRVADANAGVAIGDLRRLGTPFVARSVQRWQLIKSGPREVEVDAVKETIVFRGFTFIRSFMGNAPTPQIELRFEDILGGRIWRSHERSSLHLRTTAGAVTIMDDVSPFQELVVLLLDAAEANRARPDRYAQAVSRELRVKTPWYGWLILAVAFGAVGGFAVMLWRLG